MEKSIYYIPESEIIEYNLSYCQYESWCTRPRKDETPFCEKCWTSKDALSVFNSTYGTKLSLKLPDQVRFMKLRDSGLYSDVELSIGEIIFKAHRAILASASPYFEKLFESSPYRIIELPDVSSSLFGLFLDLLYGKELVFTHWRQLMDFCDFTKQAEVKWRMNRVLWKLYIPPEEFVEYIQRLSHLYDGRIPVELIHETKRFLRRPFNIWVQAVDENEPKCGVDLSSLDQELQESLMSYDNPIGSLRRVTQIYYRNEKHRLYFDVGIITKKKCIGCYEEENPYKILDLTPELRQFCEENDIDL